ncbi:MAG: histidine phosphatase family protein [Anaerolineales bacterium]
MGRLDPGRRRALIAQPALSPGDTLISTLRHGLTELNRDKRVGGHTDVPLLEVGRQQAEAARAVFAGTSFDLVISSPLQRAIQTASLVTGVQPGELNIEPLCIERFFGQMEGLTRPEVEERFPQVVYLQIDHIGNSLNPPGGETYETLRRRAEQFLDKVLANHSGRRIVISSHQAFMQQLHGLLRGRDPFDSLRVDLLNLELNQFRLDSHRNLIQHQKVHLISDAQKYASF